jgi:hypothetical protein
MIYNPQTVSLHYHNITSSGWFNASNMIDGNPNTYAFADVSYLTATNITAFTVNITDLLPTNALVTKLRIGVRVNVTDLNLKGRMYCTTGGGTVYERSFDCNPAQANVSETLWFDITWLDAYDAESQPLYNRTTCGNVTVNISWENMLTSSTKTISVAGVWSEVTYVPNSFRYIQAQSYWNSGTTEQLGGVVNWNNVSNAFDANPLTYASCTMAQTGQSYKLISNSFLPYNIGASSNCSPRYDGIIIGLVNYVYMYTSIAYVDLYFGYRIGNSGTITYTKNYQTQNTTPYYYTYNIADTNLYNWNNLNQLQLVYYMNRTSVSSRTAYIGHTYYRIHMLTYPKIFLGGSA